MHIPKAFELGGGAVRARDVIPAGRVWRPWASGPGIHDDDAPSGKRGDTNVLPIGRRQGYRRQGQARREVIGSPVRDWRQEVSHASPLLAHQPALLAVPVALLLGLALVVELLTLPQTELDLGDAPGVEVEPKGHEGHALTLDRAEEPARLTRMQQELAPPSRRMPLAGRPRVLGDVGVDQVKRAAFVGGV